MGQMSLHPTSIRFWDLLIRERHDPVIIAIVLAFIQLILWIRDSAGLDLLLPRLDFQPFRMVRR